MENRSKIEIRAPIGIVNLLFKTLIYNLKYFIRNLTLFMFPVGSFENGNVYSRWSESSRRPVPLYLGILPRQWRGRRYRQGRISRSIRTWTFSDSRAGSRHVLRRVYRSHSRYNRPRFGNRDWFRSMILIEVAIGSGYIDNFSSRRTCFRNYGRDSHEFLSTVSVSLASRRISSSCRRCYVADVGCIRARHVVVNAIGQQRVVFTMVMHFPAPLRLILFDFRSVRGCFLDLLATGCFLRLNRRWNRCRWRFNNGFGDKSLDGSCTVLIELPFHRRHSLVAQSCTDLRNGFCSRVAIRDSVSSFIMLFMMTTRVTLWQMMMSLMRVESLFRVGELLLIVRELRSFDHQVPANLLQNVFVIVIAKLDWWSELLIVIINTIYLQRFQLHPHLSDLLLDLPSRYPPFVRILIYGFGTIYAAFR